jgi:hypothetical protein
MTVILALYLLITYNLEIDNSYAWAYRRTALRGKQISDIFRGVWGDCAMNNRVRVVLAYQVEIIYLIFSYLQGAAPYTMETGVDMINAVYGPPINYFYAVAGKPAFLTFLSLQVLLILEWKR